MDVSLIQKAINVSYSEIIEYNRCVIFINDHFIT